MPPENTAYADAYTVLIPADGVKDRCEDVRPDPKIGGRLEPDRELPYGRAAFASHSEPAWSASRQVPRRAKIPLATTSPLSSTISVALKLGRIRPFALQPSRDPSLTVNSQMTVKTFDLVGGPSARDLTATVEIRQVDANTVTMRLVADNLPVSEPDELYELWWVGPDKRHLACGTFRSDGSPIDLTFTSAPDLSETVLIEVTVRRSAHPRDETRPERHGDRPSRHCTGR